MATVPEAKSARDTLLSRAQRAGVDPTSRDFARALDGDDERFASIRKEFCIPTVRDILHGEEARHGQDVNEPCTYLCGNSLGLMPARTKQLVNEELDVWATRGVEGHFGHKFNRPWVTIDEQVVEKSARIVGADPTEVAVMGSLTANLHQMLVSFYTPTASRYKILIEGKAFPSDHYAVESHIRNHGRDPSEALICVFPRDNEGEYNLRTSDILDAIRKAGDTLALVLFSGVQYYTGQFFDIPAITKAGHAVGANVGFDLAHAAGNVTLKLHEWDVDFAVWCSYKYLNSGPGGIAGLFIHERHATDFERPRFSGWWGNRKETRFLMSTDFEPTPGAYGFQLSNPSVLTTVCLLASLDIFEKTNPEVRRDRSYLLTGYLEYLLEPLTRPEREKSNRIHIATPANPAERGCQLSLLFDNGRVREVYHSLLSQGIVCDKREPDCIRVAPTPTYNNFEDVWKFVEGLKTALKELK